MMGFFQQSLIYGLGQLAVQLVGFLIYPILTSERFFSVEQFGIWNILAPTMTIMTIIYSGGLSTGFFKFFIGTESPDKRYSAFHGSLFIVVVFGVITTMITLPLLVMGLRISASSVQWQYFILVMVTAFANAVIGICLAVYRAQGRAKQFVTINSLRFLLMALLIVIGVILFQGGLWGLLIGYSASATLVGVYLMAKTFAGFQKTTVDKHLRMKMLKYSLPLMPTQLAGWILSVSDKYLIGILLGATEVGLYSAGYQIALVTNAFFIGPFSLAWGPFMFRGGVKPGGSQKIADLMEVYTVLGIIFITPLILFGNELVGLLTGNELYANSYRAIPPVATGYLFFGYYLFFTTGFNLYNRTKYFPVITGGVGIFNIGLNLLLLPIFGYMAAAWITLISYLLLFIVMKIASDRLYNLPVRWGKIVSMWMILVIIILILSQIPQDLSLFVRISIKVLLLIVLSMSVFWLGGVSFKQIISGIPWSHSTK